MRSEYGAFWKRFSRALRNDQNVPWNQIELLRVQPEFVGIALSLIEGNEGARDSLRALFAGIELPNTAYESPAAVEQKIFNAAIAAAVYAPTDDRKALLANERRIEETIRTVAEDGREATAELDRKIERHKEEFAASDGAERLREQVNDGFQKSEQLHRERSQQQLEGIDALRVRIDELIAAGKAAPESDDSDHSDSPATPGVDPADELLTQLEKTEKGVADELTALYRERGALGLIELLRASGQSRPAAQLDTAAEIVSLDGFFADAERGHVAAAKVADDVKERARQLVRAAAMADAAGAEDRAATLLDEARQLVPDHPSVLIADARSMTDGHEMIAALDGVEPESERQRIAILLTRAEGWLRQQNIGAARAEVDEVEAIGQNTVAVREIRALIGWVEGKALIRAGEATDTRLFVSAAEDFDSVASVLERQGRRDQAALQRGRAAECYALGDRIEGAINILESLDDVEALSLAARESLAEGAMAAQRPDLVLDFLPDRGNGSAGAEATWADAVLIAESTGREETDIAVSTLERLLTIDEEDVKGRAAFALLGGAATDANVAWNDQAAEIVKAQMPVAEASMRAQMLERDGESGKAENALLPFATDTRALRQLRDHAAMHDEWTKARDRAAQLVERSGQATDRVALADTMEKAGDPGGGRDIFLAVARDPRVATRIRGMGYSGAIEIASQAADFEEIRRLAEEWNSHLPGEENAIWNLLFALARLAEHGRALQLFERTEPDPDTEQRASLLAEILGRAAPKIAALRQIAALSDRYDRKVEALEGLFLKASLEAEQEKEELPVDLADRIRDAWATFPRRFPDQQFMQVFEAPSTLEGFEEMLKEMGGGDSARAQREAIEEVAEGGQPVNAVTLASPHGSIGRSWLGLSFLPLRFTGGDHEEELATALDAVGSAVVWDSSSLFVVGGLGSKHAKALLGVLPGSRIATETLEDADVGIDSLPQVGGGEMIQDPDTGALLGIREHDAESVKRMRMMSEGMLEFAQQLKTSPAISEQTPTEIRDAYETIDRREWRAMIASLALAERTDLPLFSDDRWIRRGAASLGIRTFGTLALVDALASKLVLSEADRREIRLRLAASGAWGLKPSVEEVAEAAGRQPDSDPVLLGFLNDRVSWRIGPVEQMKVALALLDQVSRSRPGQFAIWLRRVIEAFNQAFPGIDQTRAVQVLLLLAWDIDDKPSVSSGCFKSIVREVRRLPPWLRIEAPIYSAIAEIMSFFPEPSEEIRFLIFMRVISRLGGEDAVGAFCRFVEPGPPVAVSKGRT